jgi:hypothetical protein
LVASASVPHLYCESMDILRRRPASDKEERETA